jgi:hypothetical protein
LISPLEEITKHLLEDEEISWKHVEIKNLLLEPLLEVGIGVILMIVLSIIFNYITFLMKFEEIHLLFSLMYLIIPIIVAFTCGIGIVLPGIKKINQITTNLHLNPKKVRKYEDISLITNKRLIQKSYNAYKIDYSKNPIIALDDFEIYRDMIFINLHAIKVVIVENVETSYQIGFKFSLKEDNLIPVLFSVPTNKFPAFIDELTEKIPLKRKKRADNYIVNYFHK